ncbi:Endonuclease/exonuclease/phosphatase [Phytophthora cactorum]|nr:Endonuclease/exonuclease/phosphatase [Phytophthora cactorum]
MTVLQPRNTPRRICSRTSMTVSCRRHVISRDRRKQQRHHLSPRDDCVTTDANFSWLPWILLGQNAYNQRRLRYVRQNFLPAIERFKVSSSIISKLHKSSCTASPTGLSGTCQGINRIPSIAQLLVSRSKLDPARTLSLSNTHLFNRGDSHLIWWLLQGATVPGFENAAVVMCGDWNAHPRSALVAFLLTLDEQTDSSHRRWQQAPSFR